MSLTLCHWIVPSVATLLHDLLLGYNWAVDFVLRFFCTIGAADVIRRSEGKSSWRINKSIPPEFSENPVNFISRFLTLDETWLHSFKFNPESKMQSVGWKHVCSPSPREFRVVAWFAKLRRLYSEMMRNCTDWLFLNMAAPSQEPTTLICSVLIF